MLRDEGLAELLPACNTLILDEAHQLPDTATLFFGEQLSSGQLAELARDAEVAARTGAREVGGASRCRVRHRPRDRESCASRSAMRPARSRNASPRTRKASAPRSTS